jgi:sporulation protein YlmC with PRC-barrel domain
MKKLIVLLMSFLLVSFFTGQSFADETKIESSALTGEQLVGLNVDDLEGQHAGIIRDVKFNAETGKINYVIIGKSLLGIGEDRFALPLEALSIHDEEGSLAATLIVPEVRLIGAPTIAVDESEESFGDRLQKYYCSAPELEGSMSGLRQC